MSVVASLPLRSVRSSRPRAWSRVGLLLTVVLALVAGVMSGTARAADTGSFTPVDFSQAPPPPPPGTGITVQGGIVLSGSLTIDGLDPVTPPDVSSGLLTLSNYLPDGRPAPGEAHLFSRTSGIAPMSDAEYAGMVAMENDAVRVVMAAHGMSDTPASHDRLIKYAREDVLTALYVRLQQALALDTPQRTTDEQQALTWLVDVAQAHATGVAVEAKRQFDLWQSNVCTYRAPAPYTDYVGNLVPSCRGLRTIGGFPPQDKTPSKEQFLAWGSAAYDTARTNGQTVQKSLFTSSVSEWAIAFGAAAGFFGAATAVGLTANLLNVGGFGAGPLVQAIFPYFAAGIRAPSLLAQAVGTPTALRILSTAISNATRFAGLANFTVVLGPALIIASAIVTAVIAGIDAFAAKNTATALDAAVANARYERPDLRGLLGSTTGQQQVFADLTDSVVDCSVTNPGPGECDIDVDQPTRRADDPVFRVVDDATGQPVGRNTVAAPVSLGRPGAWSDTQLAIRDGWFVRDDTSEPTQTFRYTDDFGRFRTAHLVARPNGGGYAFQSLVDPGADGNPAGTGYQPGVDCTSGNPDLACFTGATLVMHTSDGRDVDVSIVNDRAPTAPVIDTNRPAAVGVPVQLSAALPANTPADPDGDAVTSTWTVESDQPCVQTDPANYSWNCGNGSTGDGPHGGFVRPLPSGDTMVWNTAGTYRVTRTVTDPFGMSTSSSMDVVVAPAAKLLFATCLRCDTTAGRQVQIAGRIGLGAHRDGETVTIDWGDGTTTAGVPSQAGPGNQFLTPTFWATIENSSQYQFQAVHTYAAGAGNPYRITVRATDAGDGDPSSVVLTADSAPVADPTSYGDIVSDRLTDYPIPVRLPVFTDSAGNRPDVACTAPDGFGGPDRTVTDFTTFRTGRTFLVTCRATAASGVTGTATFTVTTHKIYAIVAAVPTAYVAGQPVVYTASGQTDDRRQVGDITDRIEMQSVNAGVTCSVRSCTRTTTGDVVAVPVVDDNVVGAQVTTAVAAGGPAAITVTAGAGQTVPVNSALPDGWSFVVRDGYGNPVPNTPVTLSVASGDGVLHGGRTTLQVRTDSLGSVLFGGSVGATPGPVVFKATVNDDLVAQFTATVFAGDGLRGVSGNGQRVRVGATPAPLVVRLYDGNPSPVPGQPITLQLGRGPARFANGSTSLTGTTDGSGRFSAAFASAAAPGTTILTATSDGDTRTFAVSYVANAAPVAGPTAYTVIGRTGGLRPGAANGVLNGVVDPDGDPLTAALATRPAHGSLTLAADGSFSYVPTPTFVGTDSFTYTASDGLLTTTPQRVTIQVLPASADIGVTLVGDASIGRGKTGAVGVLVTNRGPSNAGTVAVSVQLANGLTFGTVPDGVALSADRRTATYLVSTLNNGVTKRLNLQVVAAASTPTGGRVIRATAGTALTADETAVNNTFSARTVLT